MPEPRTVRLPGDEPERPPRPSIRPFLEPDWPPDDDEASCPFDGGR